MKVDHAGSGVAGAVEAGCCCRWGCCGVDGDAKGACSLGRRARSSGRVGIAVVKGAIWWSAYLRDAMEIECANQIWGKCCRHLAGSSGNLRLEERSWIGWVDRVTALVGVMEAMEPDRWIMAGWMRLVGGELLQAWTEGATLIGWWPWSDGMRT
ncbi:hypothetical protein ACLOJK_024145 [Asimina triloba]